MDSVRKVAPSERVESEPTGGMIREEAFHTDRTWAGLVHTAPGMTSGWHHHGDHEMTIFVASGVCRIEYGSSGESVVDGQAGDFVQVPPRVVHRGSNPSDEEGHLVVVRAGTGPHTVNVDGPGSS